MKTQRYSVIVNAAYLITAATLVFATTQRSLLAAGGKRLKPEQEYIAVLKSDAPLFGDKLGLKSHRKEDVVELGVLFV